MPLQSQPGEKWIYSSSGYILLGYIIEQVSGQTYEAFLQRSIFTPLNLQNTGYNDNETGLAIGYWDRYSDLPADYIDMSIPYSAYGLYSTVGDLYIWEKALSTDQLIPQRYLNDTFAPQFIIPDSDGWAAGYGWLIGTELDRPIASHSGAIYGFSAIVTRYLDDQTVIIVLSNLQDKDVWLIENIIAKKLFGVH